MQALLVSSSSNVHLRDLTFQDSPRIHVEIAMSTHVQAENLQIVAPGYSPNTDGIHVHASQHVVIQNCTIASGDDCVSIVRQSSDIQINKLVCEPGHGISIGSLGNNDSEVTVSDIIVNGASLSGTQNGLRIKTWQSSAVQFHNVTYIDITGTSPTKDAIKLNCSGTVPCTKLVMESISLRLHNGDPATSFSANVHGSSNGQVIPLVKLTSPRLQVSN